MGEKEIKQPSEETKKKILTFFLKTSVPRILNERQIVENKSS